MEGTRDTRFSEWLNGQLAAKQLSVRGLARSVAPAYYGTASTRNTETVRRALYKYLREGAVPSQPMREAIAAALGVKADEIPEEDEDELPLSRAEATQLFALLRKAFEVAA